ncbi:MAG TPA: hypothetical protein VGA09_06820 [Candidatus Binatia bacterium]
MMNRVVSKKLVLSGVIGLAILLSIAFVGSRSLQAQMPSLPNLPGGLKMPGMSAGKMGFGGLDALTAAKDLYPKDKAGYPTPNIAVSGNNVVIAWATGVVTVESISADGTIHRTILGPPTDKNTP